MGAMSGFLRRLGWQERLEISCKIRFLGNDESGLRHADFEMPVGYVSGNVLLVGCGLIRLRKRSVWESLVFMAVHLQYR